jgi:hypothetical protein
VSEQLTTVSRERWQEILSQYVTPEIEPPIRRKTRRYGVEFGVVRLLYEENGDSAERIVSLLQASTDGMMIKNHKPIRTRTRLCMELTLGDDTVSLRGHVAHCTQTVGGYKVGIELEFADGQ